MKSLIIGKGQVGKSLHEVIWAYHETHIKDKEELELDGVEVLHLCFPYSENFIQIANEYIDKYKPLVTINHSSVSIGTTEQLKGDICYSPIRGRHPNLVKGIKFFEKFVAVNNKNILDIVIKYFLDCGIVKVSSFPTIRELEFCKLMSNIRYGYEICFMQEAERIAKKFNIELNRFKIWELSYNDGYKILNESNMIRPILYSGVIGGHCIMQNLDILSKQYISEMFNWMKFSNTKKIVEEKKKDDTI